MIFHFRFREPFNGFSHLIGSLLSLAGAVYLVSLTLNHPLRLIAVLIYAASLFAVFTSSAVYHLSVTSEHRLLWLQRFDHAAIYLLIAGTYTPYCLILIGGEWRWILLSSVWGMALAGLIYKLFWLVEPGILSLLYYVVMACLVFLVPFDVLQAIPQFSQLLLMIGGIVLVIGAVIFGLQRPNFHLKFGYHELWHILVLVGSGLNFFAIAYFITA